MSLVKMLPDGGTHDELVTLIATLHETGRRLEEITAGEIDAVADPQGRAHLLPEAQERLRSSEAAKQSAILDALPAHIAMIDAMGAIISVNASWRTFADANATHVGGTGVGRNYLDICDSAVGPEASEAREVATGIRSVLSGTSAGFSLEYPCHSPTEKRWFHMTVTPLGTGKPVGAVIMHVDVSERQRMETSQRDAQHLLDNIVENIPTAVHLRSVQDDFRIVMWNKAAEKIFGISRDAAIGRNVHDLWHDSYSDPMLSTDLELIAGGGVQDIPDRLIPKSNGDIVHVHLRKVALLDEAGDPSHVLVIADDISERLERERELRRFRAAMDISADAIVLIDAVTLRYIDVNQTLCDFVGLTRDQVLARTVMDLTGQDRDAIATDYADLIAKGDSAATTVEGAYHRRDGALIAVESRRQALRTETGWIIVANIRDVTERKKAEAGIRRLNRVYAVLSGINTLIVRVRDRDELFREACAIAVKAGGFRMAWVGIINHDEMQIVPVASAGLEPEFITTTTNRFSLRDEDAQKATWSVRAVREKKALVLNDIREDSNIFFAKKRLADGIHSMAFLPLMVGDSVFGVLTLYAAEIGFFDEKELTLLNELAGDIAFAVDHIDKQERLDYLAYYDVLTGLANRSLFLERVAQYMRSAAASEQKLALFLIDLERFKNINDSLGRTVGDTLLCQVATWITHKVGDVNLLARIGADQFAVVLPVIRADGAVEHLIERATSEFLEHPFQLNDAVLRIGVKMGVALFPEDGTDADSLFTNAEAALKKAKASGDRYLFYTQKMTETVARKLTLETRLRHALENEEFVLHYQPKINLASSMLTGAEALIRWNDPQTGLVPPGQFIPILEETGLIYEVGRWALKKAIADYLRWRALGLSAVRVAVNVSPLQLRNRDFAAEIERVVSIGAHAAEGLELEITESVIMADVKHSIACLQDVRALNVKIAIDDFGTGFSSLSYLSRLPVDTLKIDRSFVVDMTGSPDGLALVSTVINLAHSMRLNVVAEGVETEEQSRLLRLLSCDEMQGFLLSKALPVEQFETLFLGTPAAPITPAR